MNQKVLELQFKDGAGKARKIVIKNPLANLDVQTAFESCKAIIETNIFYDEKGVDMYAEAVGAAYVTRSEDEIYDAKKYNAEPVQPGA